MQRHCELVNLRELAMELSQFGGTYFVGSMILLNKKVLACTFKRYLP